MGHHHHHHASFTLLLACLAGLSASEREQRGTMAETPDGPMSVQIHGSGVVTVGVPYGFTCTATCVPACTFSWVRDNVTSRGPQLDLRLKQGGVASTVLTCIAVNPTTKRSVTVHKTLEVTEGPSNIQLTGPTWLTSGVASAFSCSADCNPSCNYTWTVIWVASGQRETLLTAQGNTISFEPHQGLDSETLICQAANTASDMFVSTRRTLPVAKLQGIYIYGPSSVTLGNTYQFTCLVTCLPSCNYTWTLGEHLFHGNQIQTPVFHKGTVTVVESKLQLTISDDGRRTEPLTCEAQNTASGATVNSTKTLTVTDPISVRPASSNVLPVSGQSFSLQCVGSQNPASVTWLKDSVLVAVSSRVRLSDHNTTLTFSPLRLSDGGTYRCDVAESGSSIKSVGYKVEVDYGPTSVQISGPDTVTVGVQYEFQCSAQCFPNCTFTWLRDNVTSSHGPQLHLRLGVRAASQVLTCIAVNPVTQRAVTVHKTVEVAVGLSNIKISGPTQLLVGVDYTFSCSADCYPSCSYTWMLKGNDGLVSSTSQGNTISVKPSGGDDNETLVCEAQNDASGMFVATSLQLLVSDGPTSVQISGPDTVTVGVQYEFQCSAQCFPNCTFTWLRDNVTSSHGPQLHLRLIGLVASQVLTCIAVNPATQRAVTVHKTVEVAVGVSNIQISGPTHLLDGVSSTFSCSADCYPSCNYTWMLKWNTEVLRTSQGNTVSVTPNLHNQTLVCEARNTASGMFVATSLQLSVSDGLSNIKISGPTELSVGVSSSFSCSADCHPSCNYTWMLKRNVELLRTSQGNTVSVTPSRGGDNLTLVCEARNTASGMFVATSVRLTVANYIHVRPASSNTFPVPVSGQSFSLQCVGSQNPASITWLKDSVPVAVSSRVRLSDHNATLTFSSIQLNDNGTYQCEVTESGTSVTSVGYRLEVDSITWPVITSNSEPVGGQLVLFPGSSVALECSAPCRPACFYRWFYGGQMIGSNASLSFAPVHQGTLTCDAHNPAIPNFIYSSSDITVIILDPISVRPASSNVLPVSGQSFSLQCVGSQNPASVTWLKDSVRVAVSSRVRLSDHNTTLTFSSLLTSDSGTYQCEVAESGTSVTSAGYKVEVDFGPSGRVTMVSPSGRVGAELVVLPGSSMDLGCLAVDCRPACSYSWLYDGRMIGSGQSLSLAPVAPPHRASLQCVATNPATRRNDSVETTVIIPDGPLNVSISGPDAIEVGVTASFTCTATCTPACTYTWSVHGRRMTGSVVDVTVNRRVGAESISCRAQNPVTGRTASVNHTVSVYDPHWCGC